MNFNTKILVVLMLGLACFAINCGTAGFGKVRAAKSGSDQTYTDSASSQSESVTASTNPEEVIKAAYEKLLKAKSYRARSEANLGKATINTTVEYVAPDRRHIVQTSSAGGRNEMLIIGPKTFVKEGDKWSPSPLDLGGLSSALNPENADKYAAAPTPAGPRMEFKIVGPGSVDGIPVMVYQSTMPPDSPGESTQTTTYSVGTRDGLLYRTETERKSPRPGGFHMTITGTYSDYGAAITIESPQ